LQQLILNFQEDLFPWALKWKNQYQAFYEKHLGTTSAELHEWYTFLVGHSETFVALSDMGISSFKITWDIIGSWNPFFKMKHLTCSRWSWLLPIFGVSGLSNSLFSQRSCVLTILKFMWVIKWIRNIRFGLHYLFFTFCGFTKCHNEHININN